MKSRAARRQALVVLGMHRSGTSALTRLLNLAGAFLPEALMPPVPGNNDRGFWEPVELVAIDERALAAAQRPWDTPRGIPPGWFASEAAEHTVHDLMRFLDRQFSGQRLLVLKDPRLCRIVPLLRIALERSNIAPLFVLSLRHPTAVAASLQARDRMPLDHGRALWLRYMLDAERGSRKAPRLVVSFDELVGDWRRTLGRISAALRVSLAEPSRIAPAVSEFIEPALVHHATAKERLPELIDETWTALNRMRAGDDSAKVRARLDRVWSVLERADEVLGAAFSREMALRPRLERQARERERELSAARESLRVLQDDATRQAGALSSLAETLSKRDDDLRRAAERALEREERKRALKARIETLRAEAADRQHALEKLGGELREREQSLSAEIETLRAEVADRQRALEKLGGELRERGQSLSDEIETLRAEVADRQRVLEKLGEELQQREQSLSSLRAELDELTARERRQGEKLHAAQSRLAAREETIQELREQVEAARAELASHKLLSKQKRKELEQQTKRMDERLRFLQSMSQAALERARLGRGRGA